MEIEFAGTNDETKVRQLLADCDLPVEDLTASHLQHFFVVKYLQTSEN